MRSLVRNGVLGVVLAGSALFGAAQAVPARAGAPPGPALPAAPSIIATFGTWQVADPSFAALPGAQAYSGVLGRSAFRIEVPDNWNGELVMYAHGYRGEGTLLTVSDSPIREHLIDEGFAWAASSYAQNGYDPDLGTQDTLDLRDYFIARFGMPSRTYLEGTSMGGHVVVASLEQHPGVYNGALAECGALMQEQEIDYLAAYTTVADLIAGAAPLPAADAASFTDLVKNQILPALGTPDDFTAAGETFAGIIENLTGGPRPFRLQGLKDFYTGPFQPLTQQPQTSLAGLAAATDYLTYHANPGGTIDDATLNADVYRVQANPAFRNQQTNPTFALPTGQITVPLLTYHTTGDNFVPIFNEINYRKLVDAAGAGDLLVQRGVRAPDHCEFDTADLEQGFDDLVGWVENGVKPQGDNFLAPDLTDLGRRWTHHVLPGDNAGY